MIYLDYAATNPFTKYPCSKYGSFLNPNANYAYKEQKLLDDCANRVKAAIGAMWLSDKLNDCLGDFKLHGTPNLVGAMAIVDATEDACKNAEEHEARAYELYRYMLDKFTDNNIHGAVINNVLTPDKSNANEPAHSVFAINAIMFDDINADSLQQYLASKQIYIGIGGSACSSLHDFKVLNACGLTNDEASHVVRVSFGENTTYADVDKFVNTVVEYREKFVR